MINAALRPAPDIEIEAELAALFATMGRRSGDEDDAKTIIAIYLADLAGIPGVALKQACADFRQGRAGDGKWVPTQAQIRARANEHLVAPRKELGDIERVLTAKVVPPINRDAKDKVLDHVNKTIAILKANSHPTKDVYRLPTKLEAEKWLETDAARIPAPPLSDAIRKTLGIGE